MLSSEKSARTSRIASEKDQSNFASYVDSRDVYRPSFSSPASTSNDNDLPPPPPYTPRAETLPCVIPQIATSWFGPFMCPFARGYAPKLQQYNISEARFLKFVDGFNEAFVASPVLQVPNLVGMVAQNAHGVFPVQLGGTVLSLAANIGIAAVSITRARSYMKAANEELFHPVGLHAQVMTTKKMLPKIDYPAERMSLLPVDHNQHASDDEAPTDAMPGQAALQRRHGALEGYVQPLDFDVPPSAESETLMKRIGDWQVSKLSARQHKKSDKSRAKHEKKRQEKNEDAEEEQRKMEEDLAKLDIEYETQRSKADRKMTKEGHKPGKAQKIEADFEKELRKIDKDRAKVIREGEKEIQKKLGDGQKELGKQSRKEEKMANKVRWIVISKWVPETAGDEVEEDGSVGST